MHQFVHLNGYSLHLAATRKKEARTLGDVMGEMLRQPGYCSHLEIPRKPVHVYGHYPEQILPWVEAQHAKQTISGRHLRKDSWVALVGVSSWPVPAEKVRASMEETERFKAWQQRDVAWVRKTFQGAQILSVVLHTDERYLHHHWVVVAPSLATTMDLHPGHRAKRLSKAAGRDTTTANRDYCSAMQAFQDSYHDEVAGPCGLIRISAAPRRRVSTAAHRAAVAAGDWIPGVGPVCAHIVNKPE